MIMEDSKIEMHMGQAKWAEMAAWGIPRRSDRERQ